MTPIIINGYPAFARFQDADVVPIIQVICEKIRVVRPLGGAPRLYLLTGNFKKDPANTNQIIYEHLGCGWLGDATYKVFFDMLLSNKDLVPRIYAAYEVYVQETLAEKHSPMSHPRWIQVQFEHWQASGYGVLDEEPVQLSHDKLVYCMAYIDDQLFQPGPYPAWENFMSQMEAPDRDVFAAFVYAALDEKNLGRQMLYLYDNGKTGKSDVAAAISDMISQVAISIASSQFESRFFFSDIFGKRLVIIPDCHYPKISKNDRIKMLTGNDNACIERKFQSPFLHNVYARVLVASNFAPNAETYREHETSRLIVIKLDHAKCATREHYSSDGIFVGNNQFRIDLKNQIYAFLFYAKECYARLCPNHRELIVPDSTSDNVVSDFEDIFRGMLADYFTVTKDKIDIMYVNDMYDCLETCAPRLFRRNDNNFLHEWKQFLENEGVIYKRTGTARRRIFVGIRRKDPMRDSSTTVDALDIIHTQPITDIAAVDVDISEIIGESL